MATAEGTVVDCHSHNSFKQNIQEGITNGKLVVVDFTASWCGPCRIMSPIFSDLAKRFPNVIFLKVDVDELEAVAAEWLVEAVPTFVFVKDGKEIERFAGARKEELQKKIETHLVPFTLA